MRLGSTVLFFAAISITAAQAQSGAERTVRFRPGATGTEIAGSIRGYADVTYRLRTAQGQVMQVLFAPGNRSCYFNAFEPGRQDAVHVGSTSGNEFGRSPTVAGDYRFQVYLMRNAARRNETCRFRISFELTGAAGGASPGVSDRQMRDACRARVGAMYGTQTRAIRLAAIRPGRDGARIDGTVDKRAEGVKRFRCLFTPERQLRDVMAMTPDGE